ncbi:somatostatin receptor type 4-like [Glandiceps talaboti]
MVYKAGSTVDLLFMSRRLLTYDYEASSEEPDDSFQSSDNTTSTPSLLNVIVPPVFSMIFVIGVIGNTFTIYVVTRRIKLKSTTSVYILSLACADLIFVLACPMVAVDYLITDYKFGEIGCRLIFGIDIMTMLTGVFTLTVMSADRFFAVVFPLKAMAYRLRAIASYVNIAVWVTSLLFSLPMMIMVKVKEVKVEEPNGTTIRSCQTLMDEQFDKIYKTIVFVFAFPIPFLIITVCYVTIVCTLLSKNGSTAMAETSKSRQTKKRVARMVLVIVVVFFICWLPFWLLIMLNVYGLLPLTQEIVFLNFAFVCLSYSNSCANPLLYTLLSHNVRRKLRMRGSSTLASDRISEANTTQLTRKSIRYK